MHVVDLFDRGACINPKGLAFGGAGGDLTYREAQALTVRIAKTMQKLGFRVGSRFAIYSPNCGLAMVAVLGGMRAGGIWCNLNLRNALGTNIDLLKRNGCKILFFHSSTTDQTRRIKESVSSIEIAVCLDQPLSAVRLRDINQLNRPCPKRPPLQSLGEILQVLLQFLPIVTPRLSVYSRSRFPFKPKIAFLQTINRINVVKERPESLLPMLLCRFPYPLKRTRHASPALSPERGLLKPLPLGQLPSLHPPRGPLTDFVRRLPGYCGVVRLPTTLHHRLASSEFPMPPPFPREQRQLWDLPIPVQGVFVCARGLRTRRVRAPLALSMRTVLPSATSTVSAPWNKNHFTAQ